MRKLVHCTCLLLLVLFWREAVSAESQSPDLRRAVPSDVYLAIHATHNPERDFQRAYVAEICETFRDTQIMEKLVKIVTAKMPEDDLNDAKAVLAELKQAVDVADWHAVLDCQDFIYAQSMQIPTAQHLALMRLTPDAAASIEKAVQNLLGLVEKYSEGQVPAKSATEGDATITSVGLPPQVPFSPTLIRLNDVLILASSDQLARQSLGMLLGNGGESKFDDPRLKAALSKLPAPEDSLVFYDARQQFTQMQGMGQFIRQLSGGDPEAERAAGLMDIIFKELQFADYEITVEYTEDNRNRSASYGRYLPGTEDKLLMKVLGSGQPFEDWQSWVPADAISYSLSTGANLHPVYEWVMKLIDERFPEAEEGLAQFQQIQEAIDVHLDRDLLQAFSGENVSVTFPAAQPSAFVRQDSVTALRCSKPERIRELLHRAVEQLQQLPPVQAQKLELKPCEGLEGFEEISATMLASFGVKPVIGDRDGWLIIGSSTHAVQKVLDAKDSEQTISQTDGFKQFNLPVEGAVQAIKYTNLAESTRQVAMALRQVGMVLPMVVGMAGADASEEWMAQVQEIVGLLPDVAQIVEKFDYLEAKLAVTQLGDEPGTYMRRSVTSVRAPSAD